MILEKGEQLEDLGCKNLKIIQNKTLYTFTSDSVILANFLKIKPNESAVEIGGGCGVVSILATAKNRVKTIKIFEIQEKLQKLCEKNIILNNLGGILELIPDDVKNFRKYFEIGSYDVVFSNPPYFSIDKTVDSVRKFARQEVFLTLADLVKTSAQILKFGGRLYLTYPASRLCELVFECEKNNIKLKRMFFTENGKGVVNLIVVEGVKGGKNGVKILPNLITNTESGDFLENLKTKKFSDTNLF